MGAVHHRVPLLVAALALSGATLSAASPPVIPILEPGLWIFEIETRREGQPVEKRTIRDCVDLRGLYSAERPTDCARIDTTRSPDGTELIVEMECAVPPKLTAIKRLVEDRGRGPLDYAEPGISISSRSVFTGDFRRNYVRDNITTVESPPGERQVTRSVTRGVWQSAACPADLPPDDLRRWIRMPIPRSAPVADTPDQSDPIDAIERPPRPVMRAGLWSSRLVTRVDKGKPIIEETRHCVRSALDRGGMSIPTMDVWGVCGLAYRAEAAATPEGFEMTIRCDASSRHLMVADLDFEQLGPAIDSRSEFKGDFAARFSVRHSTTAAYPSGRRNHVVATNEFVRIGDCPSETETQR
jgi:hypothetical protein